MSKPPSLDPVWEELYKTGHAERYPWDMVVSFVFHHVPKDRPRSAIRILEVGCGTGSNLWFAAREGFSVFGVDGSQSAISFAQHRFDAENLQGDLRVADFTSLPFDADSFDLVIDRCALTCCGKEAVEQSLSEIHRVLKPKGRFLFNPYSDRHSSFACGEFHADGLVTGIKRGTLTSVGQIRFYGRQQILDALKDFKLIKLEHTEHIDLTETDNSIHAEWSVIVEKQS